MRLTPGSLDANGDFVEPSSLAKAIDDALPNKPQFGQAERRQFIIAIATGILNYLKENRLIVDEPSGSQSVLMSDDAGGTLLKIDVQQGVVTIQASTKVIIESPSLEIVKGAGHPAVFGDSLLQYLTELATAYKTHTHTGQTADGLSVTATQPTPSVELPDQKLLSTKILEG